MFCRFCGKTVPDDSRVCMFCGKTLELDNAKKSVTQKETPIVSNVTPLAYTSDKVLVEKPNQKRLGVLNVFAWIFTTICLLFLIATLGGIFLSYFGVLPGITNYLLVPYFYVMYNSYLFYIAIGLGGLGILLSAIYMFVNTKRARPIVSFVFNLLFAGLHILGLVWGYQYITTLLF
ncbi:MAG: zinc ribbon domain-containing protein [Clostridia bacterium]|nr:zinc ribbon domain-containing protein [Clostridia bacterium]